LRTALVVILGIPNDGLAEHHIPYAELSQPGCNIAVLFEARIEIANPRHTPAGTICGHYDTKFSQIKGTNGMPSYHKLAREN
jgi:hypothetical protein